LFRSEYGFHDNIVTSDSKIHRHKNNSYKSGTSNISIGNLHHQNLFIIDSSIIMSLTFE
jgi:hypothetical protein